MNALAIRRRPAMIAGFTVALAIAGLLLLSTPAPSLALDPRGALCGPAVSGKIAAQFELAHASDYHQKFPKMGISPELDVADSAFFVVYGGSAEIFGVSGGVPAQDADGNVVGPAPPVPTTYSGVVCAVVAGERIVYVNVDTN